VKAKVKKMTNSTVMTTVKRTRIAVQEAIRKAMMVAEVAAVATIKTARVLISTGRTADRS
jgi:hypothetical protein